MPTPPPPKRRQDGTLLATLLVCFLGFCTALFIIAVYSSRPGILGMIATAAFLITVGILTGFNRAVSQPLTDYAAWVFRERRGDPTGGYEPKKSDAPVAKYGTNKPAEVADIRRIKEQANVWAPADARKKRKKSR